jgi:hypothetical protein
MAQASDQIVVRINALKRQGKRVCKLSWPIHVSGFRFACELLDEAFEPIDRVEFELRMKLGLHPHDCKGCFDEE